MGKWCLHASSFIFDWIIIKVAGNQDRHKRLVEFDFGPNQPTHFGVTCPWVTKISHFWTLISLKPVGQSWSNFMCSIIRVGERLHEVLGQIDFGKLDSGERSLPFGLLVMLCVHHPQMTLSFTVNPIHVSHVSSALEDAVSCACSRDLDLSCVYKFPAWWEWEWAALWYGSGSELYRD